jgi:transcriptional antiterminator RfaH
VEWLVARTEPQRERTACRFLQLRGFTVYVPYIRERLSKGGRRIERLRPLFPCYCFVASENGRFWDVRWCVGVAAVLMNGEGPARLSDRIVGEIRSRERAGVVVLPDRAAPFKVGDRVRVTAGTLRGLEGLVAGMRSHERVAVLLQALGRITLPQDAIEVV